MSKYQFYVRKGLVGRLKCRKNIGLFLQKYPPEKNRSYITRTINHILKSRYADISIPVCVITSNTKDNNDYKSIFPLIGGLQKGSMADRHNGIKQHRHSKSDCLPQSPKDYYIFTLEKIII